MRWDDSRLAARTEDVINRVPESTRFVTSSSIQGLTPPRSPKQRRCALRTSNSVISDRRSRSIQCGGQTFLSALRVSALRS